MQNNKNSAQDYSLFLGRKFFKNNEDGSRDVLRMISFVNSTTCRVYNEETKETTKMTYEKLVEDYVCLAPDGYIIFAIVNLQLGLQDVIVAMYRDDKFKQDPLEIEQKLPYQVCRQCITNVHGNAIMVKGKQVLDVGSCTSVETIPPNQDFDYRVMTACDSEEMITSVAVYNTDTLDDILRCIRKISSFDKVLESTFTEAAKEAGEFEYAIDQIMKTDYFRGYCRKLKQLLVQNDFMYGFRRAFNICDMSALNLDLSNAEEEDGRIALTEKEIDIIEKEFCVCILQFVCIKYDKDIDLKTIPGDKLMFSDVNEDLYLMSFIKGDESVLPSYLDKNPIIVGENSRMHQIMETKFGDMPLK